jgi:hypothetical protein
MYLNARTPRISKAVAFARGDARREHCGTFVLLEAATFNLVARAAARKTAAPFIPTVLSKVQVEFAETGNFDYISLKLSCKLKTILYF